MFKLTKEYLISKYGGHKVSKLDKVLGGKIKIKAIGGAVRRYTELGYNKTSDGYFIVDVCDIPKDSQILVKYKGEKIKFRDLISRLKC